MSGLDQVQQALPADTERPKGVTYIARVASASGPAPGGEGDVNVSQVSFSRSGSDFDPDVSRDGRFLVFASTQHSTSPDLYIKSVDSRVVTQLTSDSAQDVMPKFSPDGSTVAFASNRSGNWDIYVMPVAGGNAVRLTDSPGHELHPSWSPDGSQLAFCRLGEVSGQWELWMTSAMNSGIAHFLGYGLFPEWCPRSGSAPGAGDKILFQRARQHGDRGFGVWTLDFRDGVAGHPTEIASAAGAACINPAWSPDGQWVVFAIVPTGVSPASADDAARAGALWMSDLSGGARVRLTGGNATALMPTWGPDGRVFFASNRGGIENIWAVSAQEAVRLAGSMAAPRGMATVPVDPEQSPDR